MKIKITTELLADLREKAERATPGLWEVYEELPNSVFTGDPDDVIGKQADKNNIFQSALKCNASYIAAANPAVMLALIARIEELENENRVLNQIIEDER